MAELSKRPAVQQRPRHVPNPRVAPRSEAADQRLRMLERLTTGYRSRAYRAGRETQVRRENSIATASQAAAPARQPRLTNSTGRRPTRNFPSRNRLKSLKTAKESRNLAASEGAADPSAHSSEALRASVTRLPPGSRWSIWRSQGLPRWCRSECRERSRGFGARSPGNGRRPCCAPG